LVHNGLARVYGFKTTPPGLKSSRIELNKLQQYENEARQERVGAWGISAGRLNALPQTPSAFSFFVADGKTRSPPAPAGSSAVVSPVVKPVASTERRSPVEMNRSHVKEKTPLGRIDVNTATEKELRSVPGIGPVIAARIIAARPFRSADDLEKVNGIGDKNYVKMRPYFQ
jgi:predicted flap endonuclease-1-like 5' DNA nuclease